MKTKNNLSKNFVTPSPLFIIVVIYSKKFPLARSRYKHFQNFQKYMKTLKKNKVIKVIEVIFLPCAPYIRKFFIIFIIFRNVTQNEVDISK